MKKKLWIPIILLAVLAILFIPVPSGVYEDGGTREYTALTYKIVDWNRITGRDTYSKTKLYIIPDNFKTIDELWACESETLEYMFSAEIVEISNTSVVVEPFDDEEEYKSSDRISFGISELAKIDAKVGDTVKVTYIGDILTTYPARINAINWEILNRSQNNAYTEKWLDKNLVNKWEDAYIADPLKITKIYPDYFFAKPVIAMPYEVKFNGKLTDDWCVGDQVSCTYENVYYDRNTHRIEADMLTIKASDWQPEPGVAYKPVIYLYPKKETDINVKLDIHGGLTCTYPAYNNGWNVTAMPDGILYDAEGQIYNYLYWEGEISADYDFSKGFCVKGKDTAEFLEISLEKLGLTRREANEFIVYWLPLMQNNPYNIISFQTDAYTEAAKLEITPSADTVIRVFMTWKSSDEFINIPNQNLSAPERNGFTVVEWGGTEIK